MAKEFQIPGFETKVIEEREMYVILELRDPQWRKGMTMDGAFTYNLDFIGDTSLAERLCDKIGIAPELRSEDCEACTIGFCEQDQRWYGWSHRRISSFGIGDPVYLDSEPNPGVIKTLDEAKESACRFAEYVS